MQAKKEKKVVTGHIKVKRRYGDRHFREHASRVARGILADMHPDADEINIKFYPDGLPVILAAAINHVFAIRNSMLEMIV
jgi:hypothetical protein